MKIMPKIILGLLVAAVFASAVSVVRVRHENRVLFLELQKLQKEQDALDVEWGRLQLEQSTWARPGRIESVARKSLGMIVPRPKDVISVKP
ncbi:MAG: cell division protein FtsL [Gammaproteobacteria bacterium]|nr:cell division protein FtsL [Gammaproteobacteria bacterium]